MSTARAEDPAAEDFLGLVASLDIGRVGGDIDPGFEIRACLKGHQWIWVRETATMFTTHDISHSHSIVEYVRRLNPIAGFSNIEKLILCIASLIHDVGMQYNYWGKQPATPDGHNTIAEVLGLPIPPVTPEELRRDHVKYGHCLIKAETERTETWSDRLRFGSGSSASRSLLKWAATVAFAHSGPDIWDSLCDPQTQFCLDQKHPGPPEQDRRIRLMAGVFRIADELHTSFNRVPDADRLWEWDLPDLSRLHWLAAEFTSDVRVVVTSVEDRRVDIVLDWREPVVTDQDLRADIIKLLGRTRISLFEKAFSKVNEMLQATGRTTQAFVANVRMTPIASDQSGIAVVERLRDLLRRQDEIIGQRSVAAPIRIDPVAPHVTAVAPTDLGFRAQARSGTLEQELRNWFYLNSKGNGHWRIRRTGAHSDRLVRIRGLVSNRDLVLATARHLREAVDPDSLSLLVGVGTGCIPIVAQFGMETRTPVTFTTHVGGSDVDGRELRREREPVWIGRAMTRGGRLRRKLLVVDDLVARGETADSLIGRILNETDIQAEDIMYVSVFQFTFVQMQTSHPAAYVTLCPIEDVYYSPGPTPDKTTCLRCAAGDPLVEEVDAW